MASQAGLGILHRGGNAVDAAVATALATAVVMPEMCGFGGDAFVVYGEPSGQVHALVGSGALPQSYDESRLVSTDPDRLPLRGAQSMAVPGALDAYQTLHQRFGRLSWADVTYPALGLARDGFLVDSSLARELLTNQLDLVKDPAVRHRFFPKDRPLAEGELLRQPELSEFLESVLEFGRASLYQGPMAEALSGTVRAAGGFLGVEDLETHHSRWERPLALAVGDYTVWASPLPSAGVILLEALALMARGEVDAQWRNRSETVHRVIEALRWSFYDRRVRLGDPDYVDFLAETLLEPTHLDRRLAQVHRSKAKIPFSPQESSSGGDTTSLAVVDGDGGAVSLIHSLGLAFGSQVYVKRGGFFLNNRAGRSFNRIPGHPNQARPGKRPMHTLNTYLVQQNAKTVVVGNTPGGDGQPQWNLTILMDLLWGGQSPAQAVALPRLTVMPGTDTHTLEDPERVVLESRFSPNVWSDLQARGHVVELAGPYGGGGSAQVIRRTDNGFVGASDPRGIGQTLGF